jgi:hypothetical protein
MDGLCIIEGKVLVAWENRLAAIEQNQLALMKLIQSIIPPPGNSSNVPGYIAPIKASKHYGKSLRTIYNKLEAFEREYNKPIDRAWICGEHCINEQELLKAMQLKTPFKAPKLKVINSFESSKDKKEKLQP